ncbi:MAG TPA: hypothetical protein VIK72_02880 [Clostridiaceae bacterium]
MDGGLNWILRNKDMEIIQFTCINFITKNVVWGFYLIRIKYLKLLMEVLTPLFFKAKQLLNRKFYVVISKNMVS